MKTLELEKLAKLTKNLILFKENLKKLEFLKKSCKNS